MEASVSGKYRVWLSYDFAFSISTQGLFQFLDKHDAKECGDSTATFMFKPQSLETLASDLKAELEVFMKLENLARIYLVYPKDVQYFQSSGAPYYHVVGKLISGSRKPALWAGYYQVEHDTDLDE